MASSGKNFTGLAFLLWSLIFGSVAVVGLNYIFDNGASGLLASSLAVVVSIIGGLFGALGILDSRDKRMSQEALDQAQHEARHDPLTNLMNRAGLLSELELSLVDTTANNMVLGVLFLDLNRFKIVNDTMGHEAGDQLLRVIADRLSGSVRSTDIVARFGGDEFVILCRGLISSDSVISVAKSILKSFNEPVQLMERSYIASTSIGIAIFEPGDTRDAEELIRDADAAMFNSKRNKLDYSVFDERQHKQSLERLEVERALTSALQENQFAVFYQPIVDIESQNLYAFEALVRWNHPEKGMLSPASFLEIAEEAGLLAKIGEVVLREACAQAAVWNHMAPGARSVKMSVNLSEAQLLDPNLQFKISEILSWTDLDPSQLILEITEDVIVEHLEGLDVLRSLRELGVGLAIDDFGTGQSSLNSIRELDMVKNLKIAEKFVTDMINSEADQAIIQAIIAMGQALGMNLIAEGIENEEQVHYLKEMGVKNLQGYFFSRPQAASSIDPQRWFAQNSSNVR